MRRYEKKSWPHDVGLSYVNILIKSAKFIIKLTKDMLDFISFILP